MQKRPSSSRPPPDPEAQDCPHPSAATRSLHPAPAVPTLRPERRSPHCAPLPLRGAERGEDVTSTAGWLDFLHARHGHVTRTGRSRLVAPATASPTHRVSCFPPEIGPCSPTAQDSQATRPRGDSGEGWVSFGE